MLYNLLSSDQLTRRQFQEVFNNRQALVARPLFATQVGSFRLIKERVNRPIINVLFRNKISSNLKFNAEAEVEAHQHLHEVLEEELELEETNETDFSPFFVDFVIFR